MVAYDFIGNRYNEKEKTGNRIMKNNSKAIFYMGYIANQKKYGSFKIGTTRRRLSDRANELAKEHKNYKMLDYIAFNTTKAGIELVESYVRYKLECDGFTLKGNDFFTYKVGNKAHKHMQVKALCYAFECAKVYGLEVVE